MALVLADRVQETTTSTGTGTITLAGAVQGFQSFSVVGNGNTTYYTISSSTQWEVGIGTYTASGTTLSRDTVLSSSNSGNLVDFTAGTKTVFVTYPSGRVVIADGTSISAANSSILPVSSGGTGSNSATFSGENITSLNASNISAGTLANSRTSASSSNGANTIVLRDASGDFAADIITANSFSGSGSSLTDLNASAISTGTIANARTTATHVNGASTIVARDASGNFAGAAITGTSFSGSGASLTSLNASSISSGTLDNARTTASSSNGASTIVARDASGNFAANVITHGAGSNSAPSLTFASDTDTGFYSSGSNAVNFAEGATGYRVGFRNAPAVGTKTGSYTLATGDVGKYVQVGSGGSITIPDATFAEGDVISIFNNTTGNITITCTITTAYIAGTDSDKASVTLATRGVATILFISSTVCVITGNVT